MVSLRRISDVLDSPRAYALWQSPFAKSKLQPLLRHNSLHSVRRVLEVGCGPGTNAGYFAHADYFGLDLNPRYVEHARRVHRGDFIVADARTYEVPEAERFDFVLSNSFFHHIDDVNSIKILQRLHAALTDDGHIHVLDLVLPPQPSVSRWLASHDRGDYPRPLAQWREMFSDIFEPVVFEPYAVRAMGVDLWSMVYFKGRRRS